MRQRLWHDERHWPNGERLDPELSNLLIFTGGIGIRPTRRSSIDLVYHHYLQDVEPCRAVVSFKTLSATIVFPCGLAVMISYTFPFDSSRSSPLYSAGLLAYIREQLVDLLWKHSPID
jgi:hypothetical protein